MVCRSFGGITIGPSGITTRGLETAGMGEDSLELTELLWEVESVTEEGAVTGAGANFCNLLINWE